MGQYRQLCLQILSFSLNKLAGCYSPFVGPQPLKGLQLTFNKILQDRVAVIKLNMRLTVIQLPLFLFISIHSYGQVSSCDTIYWTEKVKLTWTDFKAQPDTSVSFGAISYPATGYKSKLRNDTLKIWTYCGFLTCKSWTKFNGKNLLKHEQTHFDIAEYCRRLFIQRLLALSSNRQNAMTSIDRIYKTSVNFRRALDKEYDKETDLSRNELLQDKWTKDIQDKIYALRMFNQAEVLIVLK